MKKIVIFFFSNIVLAYIALKYPDLLFKLLVWSPVSIYGFDSILAFLFVMVWKEVGMPGRTIFNSTKVTRE